MELKRILLGCEFSQVITQAFRDLGYEAYSCDLLPTEGNPEWHIQDDILNVIKYGWRLAIFHPPCTYLAGSQQGWYYHPEDKHLPLKLRRPHPNYPDRASKQKEAARFAIKLMESPIDMIAMENPVGMLSSLYRKPDQQIQPHWFGHPESKRTCLWLKNLPKLKPEIILQTNGRWANQTPTGHNNIGPGDDRWKDRSRTYPGIAAAMAKQWGGLL